MKKATIPAVLSTSVICYLFWLVVTGQLAQLFAGNPSAQVLIAGAIVSLVTALFAARFFIHKSPFYLWNPVRLVKLLVYVLPVFLWELLKANWDVAKRALSPKLPINPGIVKVPVDLKEEYAQSMLANSITLTPGTITMATAEEDGQLNYYIHWIDVATQGNQEAGDAIKGTLEKWVRRIWE